MGNPIPSFDAPAASMGFIGYARFSGVQGANLLIRARSSSLKVTQNIEAPDVIDGRYDRTIYQLGPFETGGDLEFPAIYGVKGGTGVDCNYSPAGGLLAQAVCRSGETGLLQPFTTTLRYTNGANAFDYMNCIINTYKFSVAQKEIVSIALNMMATHRQSSSSTGPPGPSETPVTRVVTWADTVVQLTRGANKDVIDGKFIRNFEVTFNNNTDRFYTLNGTLYPQTIAPKKRDIKGQVKLMGRDAALSDWSFTNINRCKEEQTVTFGYNVTDTLNCCGEFLVVLPNIVYQIEDLALQNDLFETTIDWRSLPDTQTQLTTGWQGVPVCTG